MQREKGRGKGKDSSALWVDLTRQKSRIHGESSGPSAIMNSLDLLRLKMHITNLIREMKRWGGITRSTLSSCDLDEEPPRRVLKAPIMSIGRQLLALHIFYDNAVIRRFAFGRSCLSRKKVGDFESFPKPLPHLHDLSLSLCYEANASHDSSTPCPS